MLAPMENTQEHRKHVGQLIRAAREKRGWSVADLAKAIKCAPQSVYLWEKGIVLPVMHAGKLADVLGLSWREMVGE